MVEGVFLRDPNKSSVELALKLPSPCEHGKEEKYCVHNHERERELALGGLCLLSQNAQQRHEVTS